MKTAKFKLVTFLILIALGIRAKAQNERTSTINTYDYKTAVGIRAGETSGITFKRKFIGETAFEGIVSFWPYSIGLTGLYEKLVATGTNGLTFYYGAGAHLNAGNYYSRRIYRRGTRFDHSEKRDNFAFGLDGIIGIEYKIKPIPFALSVDLKPYIETTTFKYSYLSLDPAIGIKYTF